MTNHYLSVNASICFLLSFSMLFFDIQMSLFILLHNVANEHACGGKYGAMVKTAKLVYRDKLVTHALEN